MPHIPKKTARSFWLIKSEPETWSWQQQRNKSLAGEPWDGVRNYQARNHMKTMKENDICFFYHSGKERRIIGIVKVIKTFYPDPTDITGKFGMVDVQYLCDVTHPLPLATIKSIPELQDIPLVTQSRLSVMPIEYEKAMIICKLMKTNIPEISS